MNSIMPEPNSSSSHLLSREAPLPSQSSNQKADWLGIGVDFYSFPEAGSFETNALPYHLLVLQWSGASPLFQRRGGQTHTTLATPGTIMLLPAGTASYWHWRRPHAHINFRISVELLAAASAEAGLGRNPRLANIFCARDRPVEQLGSLLLAELYAPSHPTQRSIVNSTSLALAAHLLRVFGPRPGEIRDISSPQLGPRALDAVLEYIDCNIETPINLSDLACQARVSRFHFTRLFKRCTGISPMAFLEQARIERAQSLIRQGKFSLAEIAVASGFADQSHFTKRFRVHTGRTPAAFARELTHNPILNQ